VQEAIQKMTPGLLARLQNPIEMMIGGATQPKRAIPEKNRCSDEQ